MAEEIYVEKAVEKAVQAAEEEHLLQEAVTTAVENGT